MLFETLNNLDSKVSLTSNIWTSCTSRWYMILTTHYIDKDWCLKLKFLSFLYFPPPQTVHAFYELVYSMIKDWGFQLKVMCVTVDNATNNDSMIALLQDCLTCDSFFPCGGVYFHIHCATHVLNLIVKDGLINCSLC